MWTHVVWFHSLNTGAHFLLTTDTCHYNHRDFHDVEYIYSTYVNKVKVMDYNSTLNKFTGYTAFGMKNAEAFNNDPILLAWRHSSVHNFCKHPGTIFFENIFDKAGKWYRVVFQPKQEHLLILESCKWNAKEHLPFRILNVDLWEISLTGGLHV